MILFLLGCSNNKKSNISSTVTIDSNNAAENDIMVVSPKINQIIINFIDKSISKQNCSTPFLCIFEKDSADIFFTLTRSFPENYAEIDGYVEISGMPIGFMYTNLIIDEQIIDIALLKKDSIHRIFAIREDLKENYFEPQGDKYKIYSKDSLELVFSGYL